MREIPIYEKPFYGCRVLNVPAVTEQTLAQFTVGVLTTTIILARIVVFYALAVILLLGMPKTTLLHWPL